jgi:hypothetical protein
MTRAIGRRWQGLAALACLVLGNLAVAAPPERGAAGDDAAPRLPNVADADPLRPPFLARPIQSAPVAGTEPASATPFLETPVSPPLGFTGPSSVAPRAVQQNSDFIPVEDRWRVGFPDWDRYGRGHPPGDDYPYVEGHWWDPYNQNVLKGDYPIIGQNTFLEITVSNFNISEGHNVPTATTPFESTARPGEREFFGRSEQLFLQNFLSVSVDLFHGDASFKPADWRVKATPIFNVNYLDVDELAVVNPDVSQGTARGRTYLALEEWFLEAKLADLSPDYDFMSVRAGSQPFTSDFRGFIFSDTNRGIRLFGTRNANRDQFNLIYLRQQDKDTNSTLNTFYDRGQDIVIANYYRQDFLFPGYTGEFSFHYNHDLPTFHFNNNNNLVRPDPVGTFPTHELNVFYLGFAGDGHIGPVNVSNAFYWALGNDSRNPLSGIRESIDAQMAALELSYDQDWVRFRTSYFYASGDRDIRNSHATGFDAIFDNPNFAGGQFSYWQRQAIQLFGTNLTNRGSLLPDLRASKIQGQSNFVNPGVDLINAGVDFELTQKLRLINNVNFLWFDETEVLQQFVYQNNIHHSIGTDLSTGVEYRPLLNNNMIFVLGGSMLIPGQGFRDLYNNLGDKVPPQLALFVQTTFTY